MGQLAEVEWIGQLPQQGGDWGKGIVGTVRMLEIGVAELELRKAELDEQLADLSKKIRAAKSDFDIDIKAKRKLVKSTVKRATDEVGMMFGDAQIADAQVAFANREADGPPLEKAQPGNSGLPSQPSTVTLP